MIRQLLPDRPARQDGAARWGRLIRFLLLFLALNALILLAAYIAYLVAVENLPYSPGLWQLYGFATAPGVQGAVWPVRIAGVVVITVLCGAVARRVDYRIRDAFVALVPVYGLYFILKLLWRLSALPETPWRATPTGAS